MSISNGAKAETAAADYLLSNGYKILDRNWRRRECEIDIVASKDQRVYFVEVKYRARSNWGSGLDYITSKKLAQMEFAAKFWCAVRKFAGDYSLAAMEVSGEDFKISAWIDNL